MTIPTGFVLVPVEPTEEMVKAAARSLDIWRESSGDPQRKAAPDEKHVIRYKAMLAASPAAASADNEYDIHRSHEEWTALLNGRDSFIVNKGLWSEFVDSLPKDSAGRYIPTPDQSAARIAELEALLKPFADLGGPHDGIAPAFHDLPDDAVIYGNSGKCFTAGDVRAARIALGELIDLKGYRGGPWGEEIPPSEAALIERVAREFAGHMVWMGRHGASGKESAAEIPEREWKNYTQTAKGIIEEVRRLLTSPAGREP